MFKPMVFISQMSGNFQAVRLFNVLQEIFGKFFTLWSENDFANLSKKIHCLLVPMGSGQTHGSRESVWSRNRCVKIFPQVKVNKFI